MLRGYLQPNKENQINKYKKKNLFTLLGVY